MMRKLSLCIFFPLLFTACSATATLDDFFGIQMFPEQRSKFKIKDFSPESGVSYYSTADMRTDIYAYAELDIENVYFKIVNKSEKSLQLNYITDQYYIFDKQGRKYMLEKGNSLDYPTGNDIEPNTSQEITVKVPKNFWGTVGMTDQEVTTKELIREVWSGQNELNLAKANIDYILIRLEEFTTIVLKPIYIYTSEKDNPPKNG